MNNEVGEIFSRLVQQANLSLVIFTVGLLLCRVLPVITLSPFLGGEVVPTEIKMGLSVMLSIVLFPAVSDRMGSIPTQALPYIGLMLKEIFIGVCLSFIVNAIFDATRVAGNLADTMAGSNNAQLYAPQIGQQVSIFASLKFQLAVALFLTLNGHHIVIEALADSLIAVPLDQMPRFSHGLWPFFDQAMRVFADMLKVSLALAGPPMLAAFMTDLALGMVNRVAPQVQVFFMAMSIKPLATAAIFFAVCALFTERLRIEFAAMLRVLREAIQLLA